MKIDAKALSHKDVVEHIFLGCRKKGERGTPYYIHTRVRWGGRGRRHKANAEEIQGSAEEVQGKCDRESKEKKKKIE